MYRGTWLLVGIPLLIAAFSVSQPEPLPAPTLPPDFDGAAARSGARGLREPVSRPGARLAGRASERRLGGASGSPSTASQTESRPFSRENPRPRRRPARKRARLPPGRSTDVIVVVAHRDNSGAGPGANDNASGTAALLELARIVRDAAGAAAAAGAESHDPLPLHRRRRVRRARRRATSSTQSRYRDRVVAVVNLDCDRRRAAGRTSCSRPTGRARPPAALVRTAAAAHRRADRRASRPGRARSRSSSTSRFPFSLYEQAPFVDAGVAAITLTSAGDRPPPAFGDTPDA